MKPSRPDSDAITDKQEIFCQEYLKDLNATQAAVRAGYSQKNADKIGPELLGKTRVAARIQELMDKRAKKIEVTSEEILAELKKHAFFDLSGAYDEKGDLLLIHQMPEDIRRVIAGIEVFTEVQYFDKGKTDDEGDTVKEVQGRTKKLKVSDKLRALELLGKHLKLFTDKVEHSGNIGLESLTDEQIEARIKELQMGKK